MYVICMSCFLLLSLLKAAPLLHIMQSNMCFYNSASEFITYMDQMKTNTRKVFQFCLCSMLFSYPTAVKIFLFWLCYHLTFLTNEQSESSPMTFDECCLSQVYRYHTCFICRTKNAITHLIIKCSQDCFFASIVIQNKHKTIIIPAKTHTVTTAPIVFMLSFTWKVTNDWL